MLILSNFQAAPVKKWSKWPGIKFYLQLTILQLQPWKHMRSQWPNDESKFKDKNLKSTDIKILQALQEAETKNVSKEGKVEQTLEPSK